MFIIYDSKYKRKYLIKEEYTWVEQRDDIVMKLLPKLSKALSKKYTVSDMELLKMLHVRWETRHRIYRTKVKGNRKMELRRHKKNTEMANVRFFYNNIVI